MVSLLLHKKNLKINIKEEDFVVLNTIGYGKMNCIRERVNEELKNDGITLFSYISKNANIYSDDIGEGCIIMPGTYVGPYVSIGSSCIIYSNVSLTHHITIESNCFVASGCVVGGNVIIGHNSFIGLNSTIRNRVKLAPYTLVGCSSNVLIDNSVLGAVILGNPAHVIDNKDSRNSIIK